MEQSKNTGMLYRRVGNSGLFVSVISLGGWLTYGGHVDEDGTMKCMKQAYDLGVNFFDTAESYAGGQSEIAMGKINFGTAHGNMEINNYGLSRKHIIEGTLTSLKRLELDYVDIIYAHRPDRLTSMEEVVRAFNYLINQGLAFYWGTSMWSADEISKATGVAKSLGLIELIVEQPLYNMINRQKVEGEFQRVYSRCGIGLTVFSPLKGGILTGKYNETVTEPPKDSRIAVSQDKYTSSIRKGYGSEAWKANLQRVAKLKPIADRLECKLSALALA
ncbi:hypothetical protein AJ78_06977 [Emergomyces pasteurianus Ep9510]|uniref:NADP-dependent oxidoreductase domain-containing protein n=1 Tax=Emergomyces pasteurianus Ep9510 TaxID=1447872 RepID=A0A1J9P920_9EURO|nr:hypothetical protein AJ78_06977 [Emergomyces pasteurianus Ep9510]